MSLPYIESAANNQDYVEESLEITIDGSAASPVSVTDGTPGGTFEIDGINDARSVRNHNLVISYQMKFTANSDPTSCPGSAGFYDWAKLDLGSDCSTGDECTEPCQETGALNVTTVTPSMSVAVSGLPDDFVDPCGTYDVAVTLTKTSDYDPKNVVLKLADSNYYVINLSSIACSGICPASLTPTESGGYYEWDYGDAFVGQTNGAQSVLQFQVRKRCNPEVDLTATATYDDSCGYSSCSVSASDSPSYLRQPLLYIYKTPEVIYATENTVTWTIYVTNGGAGPAYEVWVDDVLGSGLAYDSSTVDSDVDKHPGQDHTGAAINGVYWHIPVIDPGGTRAIQVTARLTSCSEQDLTDQVTAGQGCGGAECVTPVSDSASVVIPDTVLVATSYLESPMPACQETTANITVRNAGDPTAYNLVDRMVLPPGMEYVSGSTEWQLDGGAWNSGNDPDITGDINTGYTLEWDKNKVSGLSELASGSTVVVRFRLRPVCNFDGGYFEAYVDYETVCGASGTEDVGKFYVEAARPEISVTKRQVDPPAGSPVDCGGQITWEITVENTSNVAADYVWVEDTLGNGFTYVSSRGDGTYAVDDARIPAKR